MFPLGTVLFPGMVLPLHVFETRYRALVSDVLASDREFGVTLITRGHEVGGGDVRSDVGTLARVLEAEEFEDGRWLLVAVGRSRLRVVDWLEDDPYPRAVVADEPDGPVGPGAAELRDVVAGRLRTVLALRAELGGASAPIATELAGDPVVASHEAAVLAGANPHDAQRLLVARSAGERLALLVEVLDATEDLLRFQLGSGGPPGPPDG
ncbi:MAG: LON peptidase substrate-binding domain-containing protein [Actinobacteria bacterium]|nr:LON peptidase substrate-binding domain-containing protein [Actinomycetota bacterium]